MCDTFRETLIGNIAHSNLFPNFGKFDETHVELMVNFVCERARDGMNNFDQYLGQILIQVKQNKTRIK